MGLMHICLLTNQDVLAEPFPADDWPCDARPFCPDARWEVEYLRKATSVAQVTRRIRQGFDLFFNLCDRAADQNIPGIEVVRTPAAPTSVSRTIRTVTPVSRAS